MRRHLLSAVHLCHSSHTSAAEPRILVAVAPTVNGSLDQASLASERDVELRKRPADAVAISLVHETVATVLVLGTASSGVDTVFLLELGRKILDGYRLNIASDSVLHLYSIA